MKKGYFVTATDTSVGKTVISAALIRALQYLGYKTAAMKPIETGCIKDGNMLLPSDGMFLKEIAEMDEKISLVTPCMFESPLAPLAAAEREGKTVNLETIFRVFMDLLKQYDAVVVEGVGGLYVPIKKDYFIADLVNEMKLPLIIVVKPSLGTLNHTMLTIHYAQSKGLEIAGLVINYSSKPVNDLAEKTNVDILEQITDIPILGIFPYMSNLEKETFDKEAIKSLDINCLKRYE